MKIPAISSAMSSVFAQPVNNVGFSQQHSSSVRNNQREVKELDCDTLVLEQKYDLACRLAAYYKLQYDALKENGCCMA